MKRETFDDIRRLIYESSGISLKDSKVALVRARVAKRMRELEISNYESYLERVRSDDTRQELVYLIDAISTNVTGFFRSPRSFEVVAIAYQRWLDEGQRRFRFWSAGCSTGEEAYSLAITLLEVGGALPVDVRVLASDISTAALQRCEDAVYSDSELAAVTDELRGRYFQPLVNVRGRYAVTARARAMVTCKRLDLSAPPFPMQGPMDAIYCRNVMIYFDRAVRERLLAEFQRLLKPGGLLFVGGAESLIGLKSGFSLSEPTVYVR